MENKQPHFSVSSLMPTLQQLESAVQALVQAAGGEQAVMQQAIGLLQGAMGSNTIPLSVLQEIFTLISVIIKAQAEKPTPAA